jgi:hypothetical protein
LGLTVAEVQRGRDEEAGRQQVELRRQQQIRVQHQRQQQIRLELQQLQLLRDLRDLLVHPLKSLPQGPERQRRQRRIQQRLQQLQQRIQRIQQPQIQIQPKQETAEQEETRIEQQLVAARTVRCPTCALLLVPDDRATGCCDGCGSHLCLLCLQICPSTVACLLHVRQCPHSPLPGCITIPVADLERACERLCRNLLQSVLLPLPPAKAMRFLEKTYELVHGEGLMPKKELLMQKDWLKGLQMQLQCVDALAIGGVGAALTVSLAMSSNSPLVRRIAPVCVFSAFAFCGWRGLRYRVLLQLPVI